MEKFTLGDQFLQYIITGITVGSVYGSVALGFNIIYKATDAINFAQGEFFMLGGLIMVSICMTLGLPLPLGFALSVVAVTLIGAVFERLVIYPLKRPTPITIVMITMAVSIIIQGIAMFIWGRDPHDLIPFSGRTPIRIGKAVIQPQYLWVLGLTMVVVIAFNLFFKRTTLGKAMAACADNQEAASLMGINVKNMVLISFALSAAIGAVAGIAITPISLMEFDRGPLIAIKGFGAVIMGGLGNFTGAIVAGLLLGIIESIFAGFIHSGYKDAAALTILLLVLFLRPSGLFGSIETEKI